ncbi:MAG: hypothetical protein A2289_15225 [Deltaproteobacteria bacterium RIFOXYA12_FULL_58_15]|nr:MAG: hypothetical protein A2289_15225 [Deltaproteobacteria bacterium RIFOXYA12_FULL_58_15]OGR08953.1 MAG: hypothetical protein A2341_12810 [Deltaproteobacteria bacterium RIFOXYB12_FULL_58_9]
MTDDSVAAEELLRKEIATLPVDEILALCYAFQHKLERLRLYLDVLRRRGGERAQFASCLICFDLARQGDQNLQKEFVYLADTMNQIAVKQDLISALIGEDPYLGFLWEMCQAQLEQMDPRGEVESLEAMVDTTEVASVDLLSDDDFDEGEFDEFGLGVDDTQLWLQLDQAVEDFLGGEVGVPVYDPEAGFRVRSNSDVQRIERFVQSLDSLQGLIPMARGFRSLVLLFYGSHMRSKSLFGAINKRKEGLLRDGIEEFIHSGPQMWEIAGVLNQLHSPPTVWEKISELLIDYLQWIAVSPKEAAAGPKEYDVIGRLLNRQPLLGNRRNDARD